MTRKKRLSVAMQGIKFAARERVYDTVNVFLPVFIMSGLLVGCFKFWLWLLP